MSFSIKALEYDNKNIIDSSTPKNFSIKRATLLFPKHKKSIAAF